MRMINGIEIKAKKFAYDGCHKIYLIDNMEAEKEAKKYGYKIYNIKKLVDCYIYSCSLRFISRWDENITSIVDQFAEEVVFEGFDISNDTTSDVYEITINENKIKLKMFEFYR